VWGNQRLVPDADFLLPLMQNDVTRDEWIAPSCHYAVLPTYYHKISIYQDPWLPVALLQIDEFKTEGEKRFYRFLEAVAKPDSKYTIWYLPDIEGKEPGFILFCDEVGLLIFEGEGLGIEPDPGGDSPCLRAHDGA
jgi:hypothetical protein